MKPQIDKGANTIDHTARPGWSVANRVKNAMDIMDIMISHTANVANFMSATTKEIFEPLISKKTTNGDPTNKVFSVR